MIKNYNGNNVPVSNVRFDQLTSRMFVSSTKILASGTKYVLTIPFIGKLTTNGSGYYVSSYIDEKTNQTKFVILEITIYLHNICL